MDMLTIRTDFPGGNGIVLEQKENIIHLVQDVRDSSWWFYWNICIVAPPKGEFIFEFSKGEVIGPWGPAVSVDGAQWQWVGADALCTKKTSEQWISIDSMTGKQSFRYSFKGTEEKVYLARHFPYQVSRFEAMMRQIPTTNVTRSVLTTSEKGREIPLLVISRERATRDFFLTCRHHSCESIASYVLEEMIRKLAAAPPSGVRFHIVPFVDIDGVEDGDPGKNRAPHDHNRDYIEKPLYRPTAALMEYMHGKNIEFHLDMHCPGIASRGRYEMLFYNVPYDSMPYFAYFKQDVLVAARKIPRMLEIYNSHYDEVFDEVIAASLATEYSRAQGSFLSTSLEQAYFLFDHPYTQADLALFGQMLADALTAYAKRGLTGLKNDDRLTASQCIQNGSLENFFVSTDEQAGAVFPVGWTVVDGRNDPQGKIAVSTDARSGMYALLFSSSGQGEVYIYHRMKIEKPGSYHFNGYIKVEKNRANLEMFLAAHFLGTEKRLEMKASDLPENGYLKVTLQVDIPESEVGKVMELIIGIKSGAGEALIDDVSFEGEA